MCHGLKQGKEGDSKSPQLESQSKIYEKNNNRVIRSNLYEIDLNIDIWAVGVVIGGVS